VNKKGRPGEVFGAHPCKQVVEWKNEEWRRRKTALFCPLDMKECENGTWDDGPKRRYKGLGEHEAD